MFSLHKLILLNNFKAIRYFVTVEPQIEKTIFNRFKDGDCLRIYRLVDEISKSGITLEDPRLRETEERIHFYVKTQDGLVDYTQYKEIVSPCMPIIAKALQGGFILPNFVSFREKVHSYFDQLINENSGEVSNYMPQINSMSPKSWGLSLTTIDGQHVSYGNHSDYIPTQSCINPVLYGYAITILGEEHVHNYVGHEVTSSSQDKVHLNAHDVPHNPMISAGGIVLTSLLHPELPLADRIVTILSIFEKLSGTTPLTVDIPSYICEKSAAHYCYSLAYLIKAKNGFPENTDLRATMSLYFQLSSIQVNCEILSKIAATLANYGINPFTGEVVFTPKAVERVLCLMNTCGMYNYSGTFAFEVGIPSKSSISGSILSVVPGVLGYGAWSPPLDKIGNSVRAIEFSKKLAKGFNFHIFDGLNYSIKDPRFSTYFIYEHRVTQLLFAAKHGSLGTIQRYFFSGCDVNLCDYDKRTALHVAAAEGQLKVVKFLIESCMVNINPLDRWGQSPLEDAIRFNNNDVVEYLESYGGIKGESLIK